MITPLMLLALSAAPSVETEVGEVPRWARVASLGVARRAETLEQLEGDVALQVGTPRPGASTVDPDGRIFGRLGLGAGFQAELTVTRISDGHVRPGVGVSYEILSTDEQTFALGTTVQYVPEGFTDLEGEMELFVEATGRIDRVQLTLDVVGGAETNFEEGDLEAKYTAGVLLNDLVMVGVEGQSRFKFGEGEFGAENDHLGAAMVQLGVEGFVLTGLVGGGARLHEGSATTGPFALARVQYRF